MSGGTHEIMAAYRPNSEGDTSEFPSNELTTYAKYLDVYIGADTNSYNKRISGDATGEMGPFYTFMDGDGVNRYHSWYADDSNFINSTMPWFARGVALTTGYWQVLLSLLICLERCIAMLGFSLH